MKYRASRSIGVPAHVAGTELDRIMSEHGKLTPEIVIEEAEEEGSPLHPAFTWDDSKAAHQFRLQEARGLIRAVHVVDDEGEDRGSAFVHVDVTEDDETTGAYLPMAQVAADPDLFASATRALLAKLEVAKRSLGDLERYAARNTKRRRSVARATKGIAEATEALSKAG